MTDEHGDGASASRIMLLGLLDQIEKLLGDVRTAIDGHIDKGGTEQHG